MLRPFVALGLLALPASALAGPIDDIPEDTWFRIPNSHMMEVAYDWSPDSSPGNVRAIISAWGGGAYDTTEDRMLVHGGGHGDYGGQEVYAMDLNVANDSPGSNPWIRLSDPDARDALDPDCENEDNLTDNDMRRSQHTYGRLAYVPAMHALCGTGGSIGYTFCPALRQLDCFDLRTNTWTLGITDAEASGTGSAGTVHPTTGEWWLQGGSGSGILGRFNPETMRWTYGAFDNIPGSSPQQTSMAIDPTRNLLVVIGSGRMWSLPLDDFVEGETELSEGPIDSTGATAIIGGGAPGFAYDPDLDRMIAWDGGATIYLLNLDTWEWTTSTTVGDVPPEPQSNGTYGRFQRSPRYGVFVLVNAADDDVYVLRMSPPCTDCDAGPRPDVGPAPDGGANDAGDEDAGEARDSGSSTDSGSSSDAGTTESDDDGCGCGASGATSFAWFWIVMLGGRRCRARLH